MRGCRLRLAWVWVWVWMWACASVPVLAAAPLAESSCSGRGAAGTALVDAALRDAALQALQRLVVQAPQRPADGAIRNHLGTGFVDAQGHAWQQVSAYAVNLGLLGALPLAPATLPLAADWLRWLSRHLASSGPQRGVVPDHWVRADTQELALCPPGLEPARCGDVDAVDSTAATTLLLADAYLRHGGGPTLLREPPLRALLEAAAAAMTALTGADGLTLAKPGHPVVYTMDAVEVVAGWRAWARLQRDAYAQPQSAINSAAAATRAEAGLRAQLWDGRAGAWRVYRGGGAPQRQRWYPDTMAQAWPLLWGADAGAPGRAAAAWRLAQQAWQRPHWARHTADPAGFWWPAAAVAALCSGDEPAARAWVARARQHWLDPRDPFAWPFQVSDLLWLLWLADPVTPPPPGPSPAPSDNRSTLERCHDTDDPDAAAPDRRRTPRRGAALPRLQRLGQALRRLLLPALLGLAGASALAGGPRDRITLLVPDGADRSAWPVKVWTDGAADEGIALELITDSQLLALGSRAAGQIAGLVVPDSAHIRASAAVVAAIKQYAYLGGKLMLVYDAGVQDENGFFPLTGPSRFSDLVGVDYVFWNGGLGAATMVGFGPVVGNKARLDSLSLPPGKYQPYVPPASLLTTTSTTAFVPTSQADPGGSTNMVETLRRRAAQAIEDGSTDVRRRRPQTLRSLLGIGVEGGSNLRYGRRWSSATTAVDRHVFDLQQRGYDTVEAELNSTADGWIDASSPYYKSAAKAAADASLQTITGYGYGPIGYYHYVTTGTFPGQVYLSSPEHGLVAGQRSYGSGQLLFVNLPLGYFKGLGSDSAPLHGFLSLFAREQVGIASMSVQPRGRGGLIYNWHIDDGDDLLVNTRTLLDRTKVLNRGPFSIHFTAGPDVINPGDGNGMDLNGNASSRDLVQRLGNLGRWAYQYSWQKLPEHALGAHGGWIHDYWGLMANEQNLPDLTPLLAQNFDAIERTTGRRITEYSSPVGNTPAWAVRWLEARGVRAMYLVGDLGTGMVRSWRAGQRLSNKLWTSPVSPLGRYATFEEFDEFGIGDAVSGQWLLDLQSFAVNHRTNRMFYTHPPGVVGHLGPINALLARGDKLRGDGQFSWYTMTELADFSQRRVETSWSSSTSWGVTTFSASHPRTLDDMTWLLPKASYNMPWVVYGHGNVRSDSKHWIVIAEGGTALKFVTTLR